MKAVYTIAVIFLSVMFVIDVFGGASTEKKIYTSIWLLGVMILKELEDKK